MDSSQTSRKAYRHLLFLLSLLLITSLACNLGGESSEEDAQATSDALQATADFLDAQATEQAKPEESELVKPEEGEQEKPAEVQQPTSYSDLTIENLTSDFICFLYLSPVGAEDWGDEQLGEEGGIFPRESFTLTDIPAGEYDIWAQDCMMETMIQDAIDLTEDTTYTIYDIDPDFTQEGYMLIQDDFYAIEVEVPLEWKDIDGSPWIDDGEVIGAALRASPDLEGFYNNWDTPGVAFFVSDDLAKLGGYIQLLDIWRDFYIDGCELEGRYDYDDGVYRGGYDMFGKCGGSGGSTNMVLSAVSKETQFSYLIVVEIQMVWSEDWDAKENILNSFLVVGELP